MTTDEATTKKWQILAVLENCSLKNAHEIQFLLQKTFGLKTKVNTVRKNLQRCYKQGIVAREKIGGSYHYKISDKGRERLEIIRTKKSKKSEKRLEEFIKSSKLHKQLRAQEKTQEKKFLERTFEVLSSLRLCDTVLSSSHDKTTLDFVEATKMHWLSEYLGLIPHISEKRANLIKRFLKQSSLKHASSPVLQSMLEIFLDKQSYKLISYLATINYLFTPVCPTENRDLLNTLIFMQKLARSEMEFFHLLKEERNKGVQYEKLTKEMMLSNQELIRTVMGFLFSSHARVNFELGRRVKFEKRPSILTVSTQDLFPIAKSLPEKKKATPKSFPFAFSTPSAQTLKIMREYAKNICASTSVPKEAPIEKPVQDKDDWTDMNSWWRHL